MPSATACNVVRDSDRCVFDERNLGTYYLTYRIETDGRMSSAAATTSAQGLTPSATIAPVPALWSTYSYQGDTNAASFLRRIEPRAISDTLYEAYCTWTPLRPGETTGVENATPTARPAVWGGDAEVYTKIIDEDKDGASIVNKAGFPYDPGIERPEFYSVLTATKNLASLSAVITMQRAMNGAVNSDTWGGLAANTVLCQEARPMPAVTEGATTFWPMMFRFVLAEDGKNWDDRLLEAGAAYLGTAGDDPDDALEAPNGVPVLLKSDGTLETNPANAIYTAWSTRRQVNFTTTLGFSPTSF